MRIAKRKRCSGRYIPAGSVGIGRKGAMPEPKVVNTDTTFSPGYSTFVTKL